MAPVTVEELSLNKLPSGAEVFEVTDVPAEPVDDPTTPAAGGWMADRRARLDAAPRVFPAWARDRAQLRDGARFLARYYGREVAFYGVRAPVYGCRLWGRAPRGTARLTRKWGRWVSDADARPVMSKAATMDPDTWLKVVTAQTHRTNARRMQSLVVLVPAALLVTLAAVLLPGWVLTAAGAVALSVLGYAGRDADRPIVHRYVAVHLQRRLDSGEVEEALTAIGIKGRPDFTSPIAVDGPGWRADLDLPRGILAETVLEKRPQLAAAMRRPLGTVWPEVDTDAHPGRLALWVAREDPAKAPRRLWPLLRQGQADLFEPIPFGFDPRGRPVTLPLMYANVLIGGVMGSGKTSAVLAIVLAAALDATAELWLYELKGSGDLEAVRPVCHQYVQGDDDEHCRSALGGLAALEHEMKRRKKLIADLPVSEVPDGRKVYPHLAKRRELGLHPLLAVFDEAHTLFEHETYGEEAAAVAGRLIRKARAYGIILVFTTQRPDAKSIPKAISDNAILRFCLAVTTWQSNDMVLGTGMYQRGIRASMFDPRKDAGTGWLARSALSAEIARAAFITQGEAQQVGKRALALRTAAGTLTGQAAGDAVAEVEEVDLLADLRAVWPAGEDTMHSHRLVEALARLRPEVYGSWVDTHMPTPLMMEEELREVRAARSTMLSTALKPYGIRTRQINKRGDGGGGKGLRWEDIRPSDSGSEGGL